MNDFPQRPCPVSEAVQARLAQLDETQWKHVHGEPILLEQRWSIVTEPPKEIKVLRYRQDGLAAFLELDRISVFFLRRDSMGEGGSGQEWFQPKLFDLILEKLADGGLLVTDGSGAPNNAGRDALPWNGLWRNGNRRRESRNVPPRDFKYSGRTFECLGGCGQGYGPVYAWQVKMI